MKKSQKIKIEKYVTEVTFEKHMRSIADSFSKNDKMFDLILGEIKNLHEDNKHMQSTLQSFVRDVSVHDRQIDNLTMRVEKLEARRK